MPKVLNKRTDNIPKDAIYIGRPSKWGNPFSHRKDTLAKYKVNTREEAVIQHENWVNEQMKLGNVGFGIEYRYNLEELERKDLVCGCIPLSCHANILLKLANDRKMFMTIKEELTNAK